MAKDSSFQDVVAGRTGKQIDTAKRAQFERLGQSGAFGKRKKCKKGKSCGASCINGSYVCMVDLPWTSRGLGKVAKAIQNRPRPEKPEKPEKPDQQGQMGPFKAPKVPKPASPKETPTLASKVRRRVERLIKGLRVKGVSPKKIREQLDKLRGKGLLG